LGHMEDLGGGCRLHVERQPGDRQEAGRPHNVDKELSEDGRV
jgi:hypothetical protein